MAADIGQGGIGAMARKVILSTVASALIALGLASTAGAATTTRLVLSQSAAFSILGHSCGGIQEKVYATGFAPNGYPAGDVYLETRCGGSGRGGGYKVTTYSAWATVTWDWVGDTRSYARLEGAAEAISETFSAEDAYGDHIYNVKTAAYLETTSPPLVAPAAPTGVTAVVSAIESGEQLVLRFQVSWVPASETAGLITSSTVTATPVGSTAPVLTATVSGSGSSAIVAPLQPNTTYQITVTNTDAEGTSQASSPIEAKSPNSDGEPEEPPHEAPEFGRCVKVTGEKEGKVTFYHGGFTTATCLLESATHTGKFEWYPGVVNAGFKTAINPATTATLETVTKAKLTCTGASSAGAITGAKTVGNVLIKFTGCESAGAKCTTAGLAEGELESSNLEGMLGIERITGKEGKEIQHIALDLYPVGRTGPFLEYTCNGSGPTTLSGSVLVPVTAGKMLTTGTLRYAATAGMQKPESFEGGVPEFLTNSLFEEVGLTVASTQTNEEAVEINTAV
ncbi:MAG: fibronectin type III domain-containing protein [Solirubrobacterales bacterium]